MALSAFGGDFDHAGIYEVHISPKKLGYGHDPEETLDPVPAPSTVLLLVYGLGPVAGVTGLRRKFKKS